MECFLLHLVFLQRLNLRVRISDGLRPEPGLSFGIARSGLAATFVRDSTRKADNDLNTLALQGTVAQQGPGDQKASKSPLLVGLLMLADLVVGAKRPGQGA